MSIKTLVGLGIIASLLLAGNIFLFGLASIDSFQWMYAFFMLALMLAIAFFLRKLFEKKSEWAAFILLAIMISFSSAFFATAIRQNSEIARQQANSISASMPELDTLSKQNDYYRSYTQYQIDKVQQLQAEATILQAGLQNTSSESLIVKDNIIRDLQDTIDSLKSTIQLFNQSLIECQQQPPEIRTVYVERGDD